MTAFRSAEGSARPDAGGHPVTKRAPVGARRSCFGRAGDHQDAQEGDDGGHGSHLSEEPDRGPEALALLVGEGHGHPCDEAADVAEIVDPRDHCSQEQVEDDQHDYGPSVNPAGSRQHEQCAEEPEGGRRGPEGQRLGGPEEVEAHRPAQCRHQVQNQEAKPSEGRLDLPTHDDQGEHVRCQVEEAPVQEGGGEEAVVLTSGHHQGDVAEAEVDAAVDQLEDEDPDVGSHKAGCHRPDACRREPASGCLPTHRAHLAHRLTALAQAVGAVVADRSLGQAVRARRASAARAATPGFSLVVAVAGPRLHADRSCRTTGLGR